MKLLQKFLRLFYRRKYKNGYLHIRFLFFKWSCKSKNEKKKLFVPRLINIGKYTYSSSDIYIASSQTSIGSFCSIGPRCVLGHGEHPKNYLSTSPYFYFDELSFKEKVIPSHPEYWEVAPIIIENDVWIGDGVFIKNGVSIGNGAIIGARSVVTKDVPAYGIVVGCPAKIIGYRFDEDTIKKLLELKWWELSDDVLKTLPYDDIEQSIEVIQAWRQKQRKG